MKRSLLFVPITKVDVEKREVWGRAVEEVADKTSEVFDYASSRPLFDAWSESFEKATDGKSFGNVRAMHGKVAAGKLVAYQPDDAAKAIDVGAKIVDDAEWEKVVEGVYTGFSIGGSYVKRWKDPENPTLTRYTAAPTEVSIVDNPCVPTATFTMVKAEGVEETRPFAPAPTTLTGLVQKGLWQVSRLADLLSSIQYLAQDSAWEAEIEADGSGVPMQLRGWLAEGVTILTAMVAEEGAEAVASVPAGETPALAMAAPTGEVAKVADAPAPAAPAPVADDERIAAIVAKALGQFAPPADELAKRDGEIAELRKAVDTLTAKLAATPGPAKGVVAPVAVTKADDGAPAAAPAAPTPDPKDPVSVVAKIHAGGGRPLLTR